MIIKMGETRFDSAASDVVFGRLALPELPYWLVCIMHPAYGSPRKPKGNFSAIVDNPSVAVSVITMAGDERVGCNGRFRCVLMPVIAAQSL